MRAQFQKLDLETLVEKVDVLVVDILKNISEDGQGKPKIDVDILCDILESFGGRDYIVWTKLTNNLLLTEDDKEYLSQVLNKKNGQDSV